MFGGDLLGSTDHGRVVGILHVHEAGSELVDVFPAKGMFGDHVDMVVDDHDVPDAVRRIDASCGIGYHQTADAHQLHHPHGIGNLVHRVAFVVVEASVESHDVFSAQIAEDHLARMPFDGRYGEVGNLAVRDTVANVDFGDQVAQTGSQDDGPLDGLVGVTTEKFGGFFQFFKHIYDFLCSL